MLAHHPSHGFFIAALPGAPGTLGTQRANPLPVNDVVLARGHGRALQVGGPGVRRGEKRSRAHRGKGGRGGPGAGHSEGPKVKWGSTTFVPLVRDRPYWHVYIRLGKRRCDRRKPILCNGLPIAPGAASAALIPLLAMWTGEPMPGAGVEPARGVRPRGF